MIIRLTKHCKKKFKKKRVPWNLCCICFNQSTTAESYYSFWYSGYCFGVSRQKTMLEGITFIMTFTSSDLSNWFKPLYLSVILLSNKNKCNHITNSCFLPFHGDLWNRKHNYEENALGIHTGQYMWCICRSGHSSHPQNKGSVTWW